LSEAGSGATGAARADDSGAWLEMAVEADVEAVEAVSEILGRAAPGGTSVEPAFELVDEGLGARVDTSRPAIVRAYVPARDRAAADLAVAEVGEALGHLQAFGLRPIGELQTRIVQETDWADAWKAYFPVMRIGRRLVIRPTWRRHRHSPDDVVLALDPGMAFGTGLHPTTRLCLAAVEGLAWRGVLDGARVLDVGCGSGILAIAALKLGAASALGVDTDPIAIEATLANARRNALARRLRAREPDRRGPRPAGGRPPR
jgi:ribosomal protein L11 methyltransferase